MNSDSVSMRDTDQIVHERLSAALDVLRQEVLTVLVEAHSDPDPKAFGYIIDRLGVAFEAAVKVQAYAQIYE